MAREGEFVRSDAKLVKLVLEAPEAATRMTLAAFASAAGVSQPTALRFCRKLGCDGFDEFRIRLAQAVAVGAPYIHRVIRRDDPLTTTVSKIFASSIDTLQMISRQLDLTTIERAVARIGAAERIELLGTGLSSVAAIDAHQKFMRLGVPTGYHADGHLQRMSCATLGPSDVAIAFSYTGQLRDFLRTCQTAVDRGAALIALTRSGTALARLATETIAIDTLENTFVYAPMTTRLAHLTVVDVLATAVALAAGEPAVQTIRDVKRAVSDEWLEDPEARDVAPTEGDAPPPPGGREETPAPDDASALRPKSALEKKRTAPNTPDGAQTERKT